MGWLNIGKDVQKARAAERAAEKGRISNVFPKRETPAKTSHGARPVRESLSERASKLDIDEQPGSLMQMAKGLKDQLEGIRGKKGEIYRLNTPLAKQLSAEQLSIEDIENIGNILRRIKNGSIPIKRIGNERTVMKAAVPAKTIDSDLIETKGFHSTKQPMASRGFVQGDIEVIISSLGTLKGRQVGSFSEKLPTGKIKKAPVYEFYEYTRPSLKTK